jgi:very-short-patch-repair endonuclease
MKNCGKKMKLKLINETDKIRVYSVERGVKNIDKECLAMKFLIGIEPTPEYRFHPVRKWRIDYAFINQKLAIEIEGGAFTRGRHTRGVGFINDMEKYNALTEAGWHLLRYQPVKIDYQQVKMVLEKLTEKEKA